MDCIEEKVMLRRIVEICTTLETGKWIGNATTELIEDESSLVGQKSFSVNAAENRANSGSPVNTLRNRGRKRTSVLHQGGPVETNLVSGTLSNKKNSDASKASGTANITSVTTLDLGNLEKEKMRSLIQQHQSYLKSVNYKF